MNNNQIKANQILSMYSNIDIIKGQDPKDHHETEGFQKLEDEKVVTDFDVDNDDPEEEKDLEEKLTKISNKKV